MIHPADITPDTLDITALWRRMTGDPVALATAHLRGHRIAAVTVCDGPVPTPELAPKLAPKLAMCRTGAAALITDAVVALIEDRARHHGPDRPRH